MSTSFMEPFAGGFSGGIWQTCLPTKRIRWRPRPSAWTTYCCMGSLHFCLHRTLLVFRSSSGKINRISFVKQWLARTSISPGFLPVRSRTVFHLVSRSRADREGWLVPRCRSSLCLSYSVSAVQVKTGRKGCEARWPGRLRWKYLPPLLCMTR